MIIRKKKYGLVAVAVTCLCAVHAHSASVTYTDSASMQNLQDATVSLSKFDSTLGTLTGVNIEFITSLYGTDYELDNDSPNMFITSITLSTFTMSFSTVGFDFTGTGINTDGSGFDINETTGNKLLTGNVDDTVGEFNPGGSDYLQYAPGTLSATDSGDVDSSAIANYVGNGTMTATLNYYWQVAWNTTDDLYERHTAPTGTFQGKVTYDYIAVPEPFTIGLIGIGGIITLVINRIRRFSGKTAQTA